MPTPTAILLSAVDTTVLMGPHDGELEDVSDGLIGSDAISYTPIEGYITKMDLKGNKIFIKTGDRGPTMTLNYMAGSVGAARVKSLKNRRENGEIGFIKAVVTNAGQGTTQFFYGVITQWAPTQGFGDGEVGDLTYEVAWTFYTDDSDIVGVPGIVETA